MLKDDVLRASVQELFLSPLRKRDRGVLLGTLRAYFAADRNTSSAAAALGVSRQAVAKRLRTIEERLGRPLSDRGLELEAVLRLEGLLR